ncbi:hypothetical protein HGB24_01625 [Candidatus Saccharibacteria bacterium]|nr:hypothetical protein [Candidatus Saccharibacteria bacterium]
MATPRSQRIGIWIITVVLAVGTFGSFLVMALSVQNQSIDQQDQYQQYLDQQKEAAKLNAANSDVLAGYSVTPFTDSSITQLKVDVLEEGSGDVVKATDSINASYFGWLSDGTIFDSSKKKNAEDTPITFSLAGVISGWTEGLTGIKVGSTVRLSIPSDKAYGVTGSGIIPANAPLMFIVKINKIDNSTKA